MVSPWSPSGGEQVNLPPPPGSGASQQPPAPRARRRWPLVAGGLAVVVTAMAGGAGITYGVMARQNTSPPAAEQPSPTPAHPTFSDADRAAAKQRVCDVFHSSTRGQMSRGATVVDGELNLPVVLRKLGSVVTVENALSPATPPEVAAASHKYIGTALDVTTAAMEGVPLEELRRLTVLGNDATYALADVCGLEH